MGPSQRRPLSWPGAPVPRAQRHAVRPAESVLRGILPAAGALVGSTTSYFSVIFPVAAYVRRMSASQRSRAVFGDVAAAIAAPP